MSLKTLQWLLAATVCCFAAATFYLSYVIVARQDALHSVSRYNAAWTVSQGVSEFMRLEHRLAAYAIPGRNVSHDELQLRLDILFSRLAVFDSEAEAIGHERSIRHFIESDRSHLATIDNLRQALQTVEGLLANPPVSIPDAMAALAVLEPLDAQLTSLAARAASHGASLAGEDQAALQRLHTIFTALAIGLILCGVALIVLLLNQNRLLMRAQGRLRNLADRLQATTRSLQAQNERFDAALENMSQALCTFDANGRLAVFNERFAALTGLPEHELAGATTEEIIERSAGRLQVSAFEQIARRQRPLVKQKHGALFTQELEDGRAFSVSHEPLPDGGWLATYEDISERRQAEARIAHMAHHDPLTDLPNRTLFQERLEFAVSRSRDDGSRTRVFLLDLDGFKDVNDTLGHHAGDELLKVVAKRLESSAGTRRLAARIGGDEFAVLDETPDGTEASLEFARRLIAFLSCPYAIEGKQIDIGVSIGIAEHAGDARHPEDLLKRADLALYQAKADGKGRARLFEPAMDAHLLFRKTFEADLRGALQRGEISVHYQPLVDTETRSICGYEALMRWQHPVRGWVSPAEFIPVAEDTGLIDALGEWVMRQALQEAARWPDHFTVAVNLSAVQFRSGALARTVISALAAAGIRPERLHLEITESVLLAASDQTLATLHQFKNLGVRIAMDDFGTGYSSLSNLRSFPFDTIKIDQSFVRDLSTGPEALSVVQLIISLGTSLGMETTAEGVETEAQYACLQALGCTHVQGYLFARPKPARELDHAASPPLPEDAAADGEPSKTSQGQIAL
ncbi:MAG: EAL domain-containing protein [Aurantimonas endophytica]|uniref:Diguanylate cyclase (GGDEF)-like protein/PAS domain S-box-containing protein n=1 Tax=Aurantimonas endophytica TaxID=1522175 RepID=A0A7W6HC72_9HYPH|nr:EAL domain-containing protein [Aurantimonas endophytica]MBB4002263.1 diguanylate cyclase (GGDEF)-like protein/PAS domain S-box-containing protein [Aurantimonas endophytica]MCO6402111.1 EAL domain-containing protein [Aurantimonas endophytica]